MKSISVILATARDQYPMIGLPDLHLLQPTIESLKIQSFKDFELIVVDALHARRPRLFEGEGFRVDELPFAVKHIPIDCNSRSNHRFWIEQKRWNVCGALNTGIIHAEGELLVRIDDCSEFDSEFLNKFWQGYQRGYWPCAMHIRYLEGKPARVDGRYLEIGQEANDPLIPKTGRDQSLKKLYGQNGLVRDTRYELVKKEGGKKIGPPEWYYGYSSVTLQAALRVNGYDELFDGAKGLEDCDMGSRLCMAGYENKFLLDTDHQVIEHEHQGIPEDLIDSHVKPIRCNYAIYLLHRKNRRWRANAERLSQTDIDFIRQTSLQSPCTPAGSRDFYDDNCNGPWFQTWVEHQPIFDLAQERKLWGR